MADPVPEPKVKGKKIPKAVVLGGVGVAAVGIFLYIHNKKAKESESAANGEAVPTTTGQNLASERELIEAESSLGAGGLGGSSGGGYGDESAEELNALMQSNNENATKREEAQDKFYESILSKFPAGGPPEGTNREGVIATAKRAGAAITAEAKRIWEEEKKYGINTHPVLRGGHDTAAEEAELARRKAVIAEERRRKSKKR